ncbi:Retrovirus-related Pol polyprotein from transposon 17.6 [Araneus ventricosus]|uniref:Retrovirus-related Pol polyprotein from transposon 17.6 n=1 Tax=Araneus ventricosus TaxID=182803 RepID=A0A4Y2D5R6_ARAVE|nr:Retrovirus-related Pol polyprotein from transposon 17.6 [Araneus ventricosus]
MERKKPYVYRIPEALKGKVEEQIGALLDAGLIEESDLDIAHPVVCVYKKERSVRLCVDYRTLNAVTKPDDFPVENAVDLMYNIGKANIITTLDLLKGYWAIPMKEQSKDYTSFKTHRAQYRFNVLPFGLKNAAATFQRVMNNSLKEFSEFARAYIDDIAIYSADVGTHLKHLDRVFRKLDELGFTVNTKKCSFVKNQMKYLGHIIGSGKHLPDPDKVKVIRELEVPRTKTQLRSLLGLMNYYRDYIPKYADISHPLTELTKKRAPEIFDWKEMHQTAFQDLKDKLSKPPELYTPTLEKTLIIHSDASQVGIGACLSQECDDKRYPICYASQKLTPAQQHWLTIEREAYAIVWSLKKFEPWIFGSPIKVISDHNPLTFVVKNASQSSKLQRWTLALQKYDLHIKHCSGGKLVNADALSRLPVLYTNENE